MSAAPDCVLYSMLTPDKSKTEDRIPPVIDAFPFDIKALADRFEGPGVDAIGLMGSHARGEAGEFSDVDLYRFLDDEADPPPGSGSHLIDKRLVTVMDLHPYQVERWFERPEEAVKWITGLRQVYALKDETGVIADLRARAIAFTWDEAMQQRANQYASRQMVWWIEEVHKGLEGLRRNDAGRMLFGLIGLSWGIARLVQVQHGLLLPSENEIFDALDRVFGLDSEWVRLRRITFGVGADGRLAFSLRERVMAGLKLYMLTAVTLRNVLQPDDAVVIQSVIESIQAELTALSR